MKNKLKFYRKQKNLTQKELANILNVTRQTINAIENNKYNPTLALALKIGKFFQIPIEEIFFLE